MFLDNLINKRSLIISYYYSINLIILINFASLLHKKTNKDICIVNYGKIKWEFYPYEINFPIRCHENSNLLVFEAESEKEIPEKFILATSYKNMKIDALKIKIEKIDSKTYKAIFNDHIEAFKINNGKIEEVKFDNLLNQLLSLISELGNEIELKDVINIASKRLEMTREEVKEKLFFLQDLNKIEIKDKKIKLIQ